MIELPKRVGTVGAGNMAEAILQGLLSAGLAPEQLIASDPDAGRRQHVAERLGVRTTESNADVAQASELVVLAVKPSQLEAAAGTLPHDGGPLYVSIAAGVTLGTLRRLLGAGARVIRAMPNTPALIGSGITAVAEDAASDPEDLERACAVLRAVGEVVRVPEALLDPVTGLSGSGPAYVYLFIEALTEAGIREGLPAAIARQLSVATVAGAARMVEESGEHPAVLRERVTSPGGTTIAGLAALESGGLRAALLEAVRAATARSRALGD
jgi:pyrroline-5-carboxylate reductase